MLTRIYIVSQPCTTSGSFLFLFLLVEARVWVRLRMNVCVPDALREPPRGNAFGSCRTHPIPILCGRCLGAVSGFHSTCPGLIFSGCSFLLVSIMPWWKWSFRRNVSSRWIVMVLIGNRDLGYSRSRRIHRVLYPFSDIGNNPEVLLDEFMRSH